MVTHPQLAGVPLHFSLKRVREDSATDGRNAVVLQPGEFPKLCPDMHRDSQPDRDRRCFQFVVHIHSSEKPKKKRPHGDLPGS